MFLGKLGFTYPVLPLRVKGPGVIGADGDKERKGGRGRVGECSRGGMGKKGNEGVG